VRARGPHLCYDQTDGVQRGLVGEIVSRFEKKGLKLVAARFEHLPEGRVTEQYQEHLTKPFFPSLKSYIMSGPVFSWSGKAGMWLR